MHSERDRLLQARSRASHWRRWGPYLSERAWGNPREDYSADGTAWDYFTHDHARSRTYRWTEDGIAGICDNHQRLCFAFAFWNGVDPILKERLYGVSGPEGNHGEDVKEYYYYLDSTPTHSYMKALYKYPQSPYPYSDLSRTNRSRSRAESEYELIDTGIFNENRYFDIFIEYAKNDVDDVLVRVTVINRGPSPARCICCRRSGSATPGAGAMARRARSCRAWIRIPSRIHEQSLGEFKLWLEDAPPLLFTENETNTLRMWGFDSGQWYIKDAFHRYVVQGGLNAVNPDETGTKACGLYRIELEPGGSKVLRFRLYSGNTPAPDFHQVFLERIEEADDFYGFAPLSLSDDARMVQRQAFAGLLWSKQFYHYVVDDWLKGDPAMPAAASRAPDGPQSHLGSPLQRRRAFHARQVGISVVCRVGSGVSHDSVGAWSIPISRNSSWTCCLREWYMHPNGQIPGLRMGVRRRESAGACLGLLARVSDRPRSCGQAGLRVPRSVHFTSCC